MAADDQELVDRTRQIMDETGLSWKMAWLQAKSELGAVEPFAVSQSERTDSPVETSEGFKSPRQLQPGDRFIDTSGQWIEVVGHPELDGDQLTIAVQTPTGRGIRRWLPSTEASDSEALGDVELRQTRSRSHRRGRRVGFIGLGVLAVLVAIIGVVWATSDDVQTIELEREGLAALDAEEWAEAEEVFTTLLGLYPSDATDEMALALHRRSIVYSGMGRVEEALADETAAIELNPSNVALLALLYLNSSREYSYLGHTEDSIAAATAAIKLEPKDPEVLARAYHNRGASLASLNRMDDALADFDVAIAVSSSPSDRAQFRLKRAEALLQLQRLEEAADEASNAIETLSLADSEQRDGTAAQTSTLLGRAYLVRGFATLLLEGPTANNTYWDSADKVESDLTFAIDLITDDDSRLAGAYFARGWVHYMMLDVLAAESDLEQVLSLLPSSDPTYQNAEQLLAEISA